MTLPCSHSRLLGTTGESTRLLVLACSVLQTACALDWSKRSPHDAGERFDTEEMQDSGERTDGDIGAEDPVGPESADAASEPPALPQCADQWVDKLGTHRADTSKSGDDARLSCAVGIANDLAFYWVVPETGAYEISTKGSAFDTALALTAASCDATEIACERATGVEGASLLRKLKADDAYVIVVDGNAGSQGAVELRVDRINCPDVDLSEQPLPLTASTALGTNNHEGVCGGAGEYERAFRWTAKVEGLYVFRVTSEVFSPALYVERGLRCGGEQLGCSRGSKSGNPAEVTRYVAAGADITLIVDSAEGAGDFRLDVEKISASACPGAEFSPLHSPPVTRTLAPHAPSIMTGSCMPTRVSVLPGGTYELADHSYRVEIGAGMGCNVDVEADGPVAVYVLEGGDCSGAEYSCERAEAEQAPYFVSVKLGDITSKTDSRWVVVVESASPPSGTVEYTMSGICYLP